MSTYRAMFPHLMAELRELLLNHGIERTDLHIDHAILSVWIKECDLIGKSFDLDTAASRWPNLWDDLLYRSDGILALLEVDAEGEDDRAILVDRMAGEVLV